MSAVFLTVIEHGLMQIEGQKAAQVQAQQESAVLSKVDKIRIDQTRRAEALETEAKLEETKVPPPSHPSLRS